MNEGAWTALGAVLGGVLAISGGWLSVRAQSRHERIREDRAARRAAYLAYLSQAQGLYAACVEVRAESDRALKSGEIVPEHRTADLRAQINRGFKELNIARQAVNLSAPRPIRDLTFVNAEYVRHLGLALIAILATQLQEGLEGVEFEELERLDVNIKTDQTRERILELMQQDLKP